VSAYNNRVLEGLIAIAVAADVGDEMEETFRASGYDPNVAARFDTAANWVNNLPPYPDDDSTEEESAA